MSRISLVIISLAVLLVVLSTVTILQVKSSTLAISTHSPNGHSSIEIRKICLVDIYGKVSRNTIKVLECDFNLNGRLDVGDVVLLLRILVGTYHSNIPCDLNHNGRLDIGDAVLLLKKILNSS